MKLKVEVYIEVVTAALYGPEAGEIAVFSGPHNLVDGLSFERNDQRCDSRCVVWRQCMRPDVTDGVLTVPF